MIFAARQPREKCQELRIHSNITFVDLKKAFNTVNREGPWKIAQKFGCHERLTHIVRQLHDDDCELNTTTEEGMQRGIGLSASGCVHIGLTINADKTVVMYQPSPDPTCNVPCNPVNSTELKIVDNLAYLGCGLTLRQNRSRNGPSDFQNQPILRPTAELRVKSPRLSFQHETENVQSRHFYEAVAWSGNLDSLR
nr:unnamed protein product [Spirometra erinaceieuropaei]